MAIVTDRRGRLTHPTPAPNKEDLLPPPDKSRGLPQVEFCDACGGEVRRQSGESRLRDPQGSRKIPLVREGIPSAERRREDAKEHHFACAIAIKSARSP
jgi:hypothetical protein